MMRSVLLVVAGIVLGCLAGEGLVRLGTANQKNYVIEMWRYANLLKQRSDDPAIGHEHRPGRSARLQGVDVSINSLGMRGPEPDPDRPAVLIVAQLPDTNDFVDYDFGFMTTIMADAARAHGWTFVDLLTPFRGETAADFWVAAGDVHFNGAAYGRIADQLVPYLVAPAAGAAR